MLKIVDNLTQIVDNTIISFSQQSCKQISEKNLLLITIGKEVLVFRHTSPLHFFTFDELLRYSQSPNPSDTFSSTRAAATDNHVWFHRDWGCKNSESLQGRLTLSFKGQNEKKMGFIKPKQKEKRSMRKDCSL